MDGIEIRILIYIVLFIIFIINKISPFAFRDLFREVFKFITGVSFFKTMIALFITPKNEIKYYDIHDTKGYKDLTKEGYTITKTDIRKEALKEAQATFGEQS